MRPGLETRVATWRLSSTRPGRSVTWSRPADRLRDPAPAQQRPDPRAPSADGPRGAQELGTGCLTAHVVEVLVCCLVGEEAVHGLEAMAKTRAPHRANAYVFAPACLTPNRGALTEPLGPACDVGSRCVQHRKGNFEGVGGLNIFW